MTRNDLSDEKKKEYDEVVNHMMKELDALLPSGGNTLDGGKTMGQKEIEDKYFPKLRAILESEM